jgi:hypothetical protein
MARRAKPTSRGGAGPLGCTPLFMLAVECTDTITVAKELDRYQLRPGTKAAPFGLASRGARFALTVLALTRVPPGGSMPLRGVRTRYPLPTARHTYSASCLAPRSLVRRYALRRDSTLV